MASKIGNYKIPFDAKGNLMHYPDPYEEIEWRDNLSFDLPMTLHEHRRGRSAAYVVWLDPEDKEYPMFLSDLIDTLRTYTTFRGQVLGTWTFVKRGSNYGLAPLLEAQ